MVTLRNRGKRGWWPAVKNTGLLAVCVMCLTTTLSVVYVNLKKLGCLPPSSPAVSSNQEAAWSSTIGNSAPRLTQKQEQQQHHQWATQVQDSPHFVRTQTPVGGAFVHVGKTGGSTLSVLLRNGCHSWMKHPCRNVTSTPESMASHKISSYYHVADFGLLPQSHHDFYVVTLRNPYDRVVSAFCYEHLSNVKARNETSNLHPSKLALMKQGYNECFPTLEDFVMHLDSVGSNSWQFHYPYQRYEIVPHPCSDFARAAFHGRIRAFNHLYFNFQRIKALIPQPAQEAQTTILVTRQEFLWKDWVSVNRYLGQKEQDIVVPLQENSSNEQQQQQAHIRNMKNLQLPVTRDLSPRATLVLCQALQREFDAYFWFIRHAKNLSRQDLLDTLVQARTTCPQLAIDFKSLA
jgi:Sulfotransferase family